MDNPKKHLLTKIGQYALIKDNNNKILMLQRARSGSWSLPGGRLDKDDENIKKAFSREIKEETNLKIISQKPFETTLIIDQYQNKLSIFYEVQVENIKNIKLSREHKNYQFINKVGLNTLKIDDSNYLKPILIKFLNN